ncbi:Lebercilin domain [Cinara cedri]|uniref:Lebercilin domain n=1 Tax=Cinara cedri TaxID=506608 RepID=A0A5E4N1A7_9HEMI|nr:Lebercilin domain [Cinara cedri]
MLRIKELQNELTQAQEEIQNRIFKMMEKRQETALSKYEDTHAQLPQNLVKTIELHTKNHRNQLNVETGKAKALQVELKRVTDENRKLESKLERFKYQSYGGKKAFYNASEVDRTNRMARPKTAVQPISVPLMAGADGNDHSDQTPSSLPDRDGTSIKQELLLVHGESSEISDHTEELQMNLMRQVHEDVINAPNMLVRKIPDSSDSTLIRRISALVKEEYILSGVGREENTILQEQTTPTTDGYKNPFSLSNPFRPSTATKKKL